jgi:hypothetical protein
MDEFVPSDLLVANLLPHASRRSGVRASRGETAEREQSGVHGGGSKGAEQCRR